MRNRGIAVLLLATALIISVASIASSDGAVKANKVISGDSAYPVAVDPNKVGTYPSFVKSGAGYFYDDVLEYRVWLHPEHGAKKMNGDNDYFLAFAQYEIALKYSKRTKGAEGPLVLIRQLKHINEPRPGTFEVIEGERLTEWQVQWLVRSKHVPGAIEDFLKKHRRK
jgi:hypothetical protein